MNATYSIGIDLGTYNSAAAVLIPPETVQPVSATAERVRWKDTQQLIKPFPSVVVYDSKGNVRVVGHAAKVLAETEPELAVWGIKRLLGKTYQEAKEHGELERMLIPVEPDENTGRCMFIFENRDVQPEDVCADLLVHIQDVVRQHLKIEKTVQLDAVISVPAYFDAIAIGATVEGARRAGLGKVETIPEPVAAALALNLEITPRPVNFLVFDIGGGTLDVTAAEVWRSRPGQAGLACVCKKNTGDTHLGGLDFDDRLVELLMERMKLPPLSEEVRLQLRRVAEAAKIGLSYRPESLVELSFEQDKHSYALNRFELEEALRAQPKDLIRACEDQVDLALKGAGWRSEDVDQLLLVGGPTEMHAVRQMLKRKFLRNPRVLQQIATTDPDGREKELDSHFQSEKSAVDPMLAVATGAAKYRIARVQKIHPHGYGFVNVRIEEDRDQPAYEEKREARILIPRDTVFPSDPVNALADNPFYRIDKVFSLEIIQQVPEGEENVPGTNKRPYRSLGEFQLAFRRVPFIMQVTMHLNENGELETTINSLLDGASATYVGVGSLFRNPIELPISQWRAKPEGSTREPASDPDKADRIRQWAVGLQRLLAAKIAGVGSVDCYLRDSLNRLQEAIAHWTEYPDHHARTVYSVGKELLHRSRELRVINDAESYALEDALESAWREYQPLRGE